WVGVCPVYDVLRFDHYTSRGRNSIAKYILDEVLEYNAELAEDVIFRCLGCKACEEICTPTLLPGMKPLENMKIVRAMRQDCFNRGLVPESLKDIIAKIMDAKMGNPFGLDRNDRHEWAEELNLPKKAEILYYAGCAASYQNQNTPEAVIKLMQAAGDEVAYLGNDELCCGQQLFWIGDMENARKNAEELIRRIQETGAKKVVFSCAGCFNTFKNDYKDLGISLPFKIEHVSKYLGSVLKKLELKNNINKPVTYHDPCHLGRHAGDYKTPRKVLKKLGIEIVEMERNKKFSYCCGAGSGGTCLINYPELNKEIRSRRIKEAAATGAKILVSPCPMCVKNLRDAARENGIEMDFYDLPNIVAEITGLKSDVYESWKG
ncbi:MAG: (Fe-S)-binding protein, partial [Candidatus Helarchaeales archaeon]